MSSSTELRSGQLIATSITTKQNLDTANGDNCAIELWRGAKASWQIANEDGYLHFRNNWSNGKQDTYNQTAAIVDYHTGAVGLNYLAIGLEDTARDADYQLFVQGRTRFDIGDDSEAKDRQFVIGGKEAAHLAFGLNDIQAYDSSYAVTKLLLNQNGGTLQIGSDSATCNSVLNGNLKMTDYITRVYTDSNQTPMIWMAADNYDNYIFQIGANPDDKMYYGYGLKYIGTEADVNNYLRMYADNQAGEEKIAFSINQAGQMGFGVDPNTDFQIEINGNINITNSKDSIFPSHYYHYLYTDTDKTVYEHMGRNEDRGTITAYNGRVFRETDNMFYTFAYSGNGYLSWNGGYTRLKADHDLINHNDEFTFVPNGFAGTIYINHRTQGGTNGAITGYCFKDGATNALGTITKDLFSGNSMGVKYDAYLTTQDEIDNFLEAGIFRFGIFKTTEANNVGFGSYDGMLLSLPWTNDTRYGAQIAIDDVTTGLMKFRAKNGSWGSWQTVVTGNSVGGSTRGIYIDANGKATAMAYVLNANIYAYSGSFASGGWKTMHGRADSPCISIAYNNGAAAWNSGIYSASLVFGCSDTRGLLDLSYSSPVVTFGGSSYGNSTDNAPAWYSKLVFGNAKQYTFPDTTGNVITDNTTQTISGVKTFSERVTTNGGIGTGTFLSNVGGGTLDLSSGTGFLKITLPQTWTNTMIKFVVTIYNYSSNDSCEYHIAGYNYAPSTSWVNVSAYCVGEGAHSGLDVKFGHDGSKCCIYIGAANTSWSYPKVAIHDVVIGHSNQTFDKWGKGWALSFVTSASNVQSTISNNAYVRKSGDTMTGPLTLSWTANATMTNATTNPRIIFSDNGSQKVGLVYTDYDSYRASKGLKVMDVDGSDAGNVWFEAQGNIYGKQVYGAVWNDYAEYRESEEIEPGRIVYEVGDGTLKRTTERLQPAANVVSDTFGFAIGETDVAKTPIAVAGRALVYTYEDRDTFKAGDPVCAGPNGTVSKMTREEEKEYPSRILGIVSEIPNYDIWGSGNVKVNNRIWIKIR